MKQPIKTFRLTSSKSKLRRLIRRFEFAVSELEWASRFGYLPKDRVNIRENYKRIKKKLYEAL